MTKTTRMIGLKQLSKKYGIPHITIWRWVRAGKLKGHQEINPFRPNDWYVSENDWLDIPTFIRNRYSKKK